MSMLFGNGDGTFQAPEAYDLGSAGASGVSIGDLDGDGLGDVTVDAYWGSKLYTFYGNGSYVVYQVNVPIGNTQVDIDGDGDLDVVAGQGSNKISVMLNRGDGVLLKPTYFQAAYGWAQWPVMGDINKDGNLDVATANGNYQAVSWVLGNGDGTFQAYQSLPIGVIGWYAALGDLTKDGYPDLVVGTDSGLTLLLNDKKWGPGLRPQIHTPAQDRPQGLFPPPLSGRSLRAAAMAPELCGADGVCGSVRPPRANLWVSLRPSRGDNSGFTNQLTVRGLFSGLSEMRGR